MEVKLHRVKEADKPVLARLLELYLYDMSLYEGTGPGPHGLFGYRWLDSYWTEPHRHPFFITADDELAGFALVNDFCRFTEQGAAMAVAEFFVMNRFRRKGGKPGSAEALQDVPRKVGGMPAQGEQAVHTVLGEPHLGHHQGAVQEAGSGERGMDRAGPDLFH